jgi:3-deoxy-D-manno-octulosonic-acid transferase
VLDALRSRHPDFQIAYTFFSPSADAFSKTLAADFREVLPFDTPRAARSVLDALAPTVLVFSKLDVWPALAEEAHRRGIPVALLSATLAAGSSRRGSLAKLILGDSYASLDAVGAISSEDRARLIELGCRPEAVEVTGDTRVDQVISRARAADRTSDLLAPLRSDRPTLVAGSSWPADERELFPALGDVFRSTPRLRLIIAPHEPTAAHLTPVEQWASATRLRVARLGSAGARSADVILVDRVGVLGDLYALADVAFVGGGFHAAGLHSVLEPAAYGAPVIFGPRHAGSRDAALLLAAGGARSVRAHRDIEAVIRTWLDDPAARLRAGAAARRVVDENAGATAKSVALVERLLARAPAGAKR